MAKVAVAKYNRRDDEMEGGGMGGWIDMNGWIEEEVCRIGIRQYLAARGAR